jgi:peptidoglycan/LPS O-acetylase OafA/YrhL
MSDGTATSLPAGRLHQLDGLRAFAFLAVFAHHAVGAPLLWAGVDLFFVLSGFLITGILLRQRGTKNFFWAFYYRRFLRIFPAYYLVLAVAFAFFDAQWREYWYWYAFYISNIQDAFVGMGSALLIPMWSLAVEEQFYVLWPFLVFFLGKKGMWRLSWGLLLAAPILRGALTLSFDDFRPVYALLPSRIDLLAAGGLMAIARMHDRDRFDGLARHGFWVAALGSVAFVGLAALRPEFRTSQNSLLFNVVGYSLVGVVMVGIVGAVVSARPSSMVHRLLTTGTLVYLGTISYMMYLCHHLIILELGHWLELPRPLNAALSLVSVVAVSSASWFFMEKPLVRYKDRVAMYRANSRAEASRRMP